MGKLAFVLALATLAGLSAWALASSASEARAEDRGGIVARGAIGLCSMMVAWLSLRFARPVDLAHASGRATWAIAGMAMGMSAACVAGALRTKWTPRADANDDAAVRLGGASAIAALAVTSGGLALAVVIATHLGGTAAAPPLVAGFALGAAVATLALAGAGDVFVVASAFGAATTATASHVALRNDALLRGIGLDPAALVALPLALLALGAHATAIGVMAVRTDPREPPESSRLRGFAVASSVAMAGLATAAHWWGRPPGHGAWLALVTAIGAIAALFALLLGRYYDDPQQRPRRALARAIERGGRARAVAATAIGLEGGVVFLALAALIAIAAHRCGEVLGLEEGGLLAIAIAGAAVVASSGYLAALAAAGGESHGALAHDVVTLAIASGLVAHGIGGGGDALAAVAVGLLTVGLFVALSLGGPSRAAALVLALPAMYAAVRGRPGLSLATSVATVLGLLLATVFDRASVTFANDPRLRGMAGSLPTMVAGAAACAATASEVLA